MDGGRKGGANKTKKINASVSSGTLAETKSTDVENPVEEKIAPQTKKGRRRKTKENVSQHSFTPADEQSEAVPSKTASKIKKLKPERSSKPPPLDKLFEGLDQAIDSIVKELNEELKRNDKEPITADVIIYWLLYAIDVENTPYNPNTLQKLLDEHGIQESSSFNKPTVGSALSRAMGSLKRIKQQVAAPQDIEKFEKKYRQERASSSEQKLTDEDFNLQNLTNVTIKIQQFYADKEKQRHSKLDEIDSILKQKPKLQPLQRSQSAVDLSSDRLSIPWNNRKIEEVPALRFHPKRYSLTELTDIRAQSVAASDEAHARQLSLDPLAQLRKLIKEHLDKSDEEIDKIFENDSELQKMADRFLPWNIQQLNKEIVKEIGSNNEEKMRDIYSDENKFLEYLIKHTRMGKRIITHEEERTQLFWMALKNVHNSKLTIIQGKTDIQYGSGDPKVKIDNHTYDLEAAHPSLFPSLLFELPSESVGEQKEDHDKLKHHFPIFSEFFYKSNGKTNQLLNTVNRYDYVIEETLNTRSKLLYILNEVSQSKMSPEDGMELYYRIMEENFDFILDQLETYQKRQPDNIEIKIRIDIVTKMKDGCLKGFSPDDHIKREQENEVKDEEHADHIKFEERAKLKEHSLEPDHFGMINKAIIGDIDDTKSLWRLIDELPKKLAELDCHTNGKQINSLQKALREVYLHYDQLVMNRFVTLIEEFSDSAEYHAAPSKNKVQINALLSRILSECDDIMLDKLQEQTPTPVEDQKAEGPLTQVHATLFYMKLPNVNPSNPEPAILDAIKNIAVKEKISQLIEEIKTTPSITNEFKIQLIKKVNTALDEMVIGKELRREIISGINELIRIKSAEKTSSLSQSN